MMIHAALIIMAVMALTFSLPTRAALTQATLDDAGFHLIAGTEIPRDVALADGNGLPLVSGAALDGKPTLIVFVDYGCMTLCGIVLDGLSSALDAISMRPNIDYRVLVVPLDPASTRADLIAFRDRHTADTRLHEAGIFVTGSEPALARLRTAVGLVAPFDAEHRQFAHPAGLVLVDSDSHAERILQAFAIDPLDLKVALTEATAAPSLSGHALLLCYGWDAATGIYTLQIRRILSFGCTLCVLLIAASLFWHLRRERSTP